MRHPASRLACVLIGLAVIACTAHTRATQPRTYYASLDMSSPQATAQRFAAAWAALDFMTVHLLLSPQAERDAARAIDDFTPQRLVPGFDTADGAASQVYPATPVSIEQIASGNLPIGEFEGDPGRRFDALLMQGARGGKLPFALTPASRVELDAADDSSATATLHTPDAQTLTVSLQRQPSGHWKIDQVHWPDSDPQARPWDAAAGPARGAAAMPNVEVGQPRTFYEALDMHAPDATVHSFVEAWSRQDYLAVYRLLSPPAEWATLRAMDGLAFDQLIPGMDLALLMETPVMAMRTLDPDTRAQDRTPYTEFNHEPARRFDTLLLHAASLDRLPFALPANTRAEPARIEGDTATAILHMPGSGELAMQLIKLPSGRWKVDRIDRPDATAPVRPWGLGLRE